jgi:hypothetical protein
MRLLKIALVVIAFFVFVLPHLRLHNRMERRTMAKNDVVQMVNAVRNYYSEYGRFPAVAADGFIETAEANAKLMQVMFGLDRTENPRNIRFLEIPDARKLKGKLRSGIDSSSGAWLDPWGNFYRIRVCLDDTESVQSPFTDEQRLGTSVIAWSIGKDSIQGTSTESDDVTTW